MVLNNNIVALECWSEQNYRSQDWMLKLQLFLASSCFRAITKKYFSAKPLTVQFQVITTKYIFSILQQELQGKVQPKSQNIKHSYECCGLPIFSHRVNQHMGMAHLKIQN